MRSRAWPFISGLALTGVLLIAGCGGGSSDSSSTGASAATQTGTTASSSGALSVKMTDYAFTPSNPTVKAGTVKITTPNTGAVEHELVLLRTDRAAGSLPVHGNEVDEEGLEAKGVENAGEIEEVGPGQTKSNTFHLTPGKYVMICNVPGHYQQGMYGSVTVK